MLVQAEASWGGLMRAAEGSSIGLLDKALRDQHLTRSPFTTRGHLGGNHVALCLTVLTHRGREPLSDTLQDFERGLNS